MAMRARIYQLLEGEQSDAPFRRALDRFLIALICLNVAAAILETVDSVYLRFGPFLYWFDFGSIAVFTVEYVARVWVCVEEPGREERTPLRARLRYMASPIALADLIAIAPALLGPLVMADLRWMRVFRLLRLFKLTRYWSGLRVLVRVAREEAQVIGAAAFVLCVVMMLASGGMHIVEHRAQPEAFGSIPAAMWWTVATLTTVGYGDVVPVTELGKVLAGFISLIGIVMVAMPAGILAAGFAAHARRTARAGNEAAGSERFHLPADDALNAGPREGDPSGNAGSRCPHCGAPIPFDR